MQLTNENKRSIKKADLSSPEAEEELTVVTVLILFPTLTSTRQTVPSLLPSMSNDHKWHILKSAHSLAHVVFMKAQAPLDATRVAPPLMLVCR